MTLTYSVPLSAQYYMSARHMALAKAFPDHFTYEPHVVDAVSEAWTNAGPGGTGWFGTDG